MLDTHEVAQNCKSVYQHNRIPEGDIPQTLKTSSTWILLAFLPPKEGYSDGMKQQVAFGDYTHAQLQRKEILSQTAQLLDCAPTKQSVPMWRYI